MKFGKVLGKQPPRARGKPGKQELLPNRHAMNTLTGNPMQRSMNDYAKATPTGADAPQMPAIMGPDETGDDYGRVR